MHSPPNDRHGQPYMSAQKTLEPAAREESCEYRLRGSPYTNGGNYVTGNFAICKYHPLNVQSNIKTHRNVINFGNEERFKLTHNRYVTFRRR